MECTSDDFVCASEAKFTFDNLCCPWNALLMPSVQTRNISLEAELNSFICGQVAHGPSPNANEVVCAGLRLLIQTRRDLEVKFPPNRRGRDGR